MRDPTDDGEPSREGNELKTDSFRIEQPAATGTKRGRSDSVGRIRADRPARGFAHELYRNTSRRGGGHTSAFGFVRSVRWSPPTRLLRRRCPSETASSKARAVRVVPSPAKCRHEIRDFQRHYCPDGQRQACCGLSSSRRGIDVHCRSGQQPGVTSAPQISGERRRRQIKLVPRLSNRLFIGCGNLLQAR
jgi:hypothetical protein